MSSASEGPPANATVLDELFDLLSHPCRRQILTDLSDPTRRDEDEFDEQALTDDDDSGSWDVELHHSHLPKLDDAGVIDWDREDGIVRRGPRYDEVAPVVARMANHADDLPAGGL